MNPTSVSEAQIAKFKQYEGYEPIAKHEAADRPGVFTGGYGETHVFPGETHTEAEWDATLRARVQEVANEVSALIKVPIDQNQFDSLVDFQYNTGGLKGSTLLRLINVGLLQAADAEFSRWNKANGKVLPGLTKRRAEEAEEFLT